MYGTIRRVTPLATRVGAHARGLLAACLVLLAGCLALTAANAIFGIGGSGLEHPIRDWVSSAVYILVAAVVALRAIGSGNRRLPWALFAVGLSFYGIGNLLWSLWLEHVRNTPIPSICDAFWLALYPLSYAGIVGLARTDRKHRLPARVWLDALVAGGGLAAVGAALLDGVLNSATGSPLAVATELAYPLGDLLLAALVLGVLALRGWRLDRGWGLLAGGFLLLTLADSMYLVQVAGGSSTPSAMTNLGYVVAVSLLALAAWQVDREVPQRRLARWSALAVPAAFTLTVLGLLVADHVERLNSLAFGFVVVTLLAAIGRTMIAFRDVQGLAQARKQAGTDDLTSLPNRRLFVRRVTEALRSARDAGPGVAIAIIDLDNFKQLNDTLGHHAGDQLLRRVGPRIHRALRSTDTVARLGGDEFALLLDPAPEGGAIVIVVEKILDALREPFEVEGIALRLTGSIGIASFPGDAREPEELIKRADVAMYQAKASRDSYAFYAPERDTNSRERLALAAELASALEHGGIEVLFQPKATAHSRRIVGVEALVRWRREDGRLLAPAQFLDVAELAGLSRALTRRVMELALGQLARWQAAGYRLHVAINTTAADLLDGNFPAEVAAALAAHGVAPEALVLEVTESSVLTDPARIGDVLARLGELGVALSLDDFGTGYSSLAHLRTLPVGEVKIDRSFVSGMLTDKTDAAIVYTTVDLAHRLGITVVAEGVEEESQWAALAAVGCELIQGYALARPLAPEALEEALGELAAPRELLAGKAA